MLSVIFVLIGVTSYIFMSQRDMKFQKEQKILTQGVLDIVGDNNITEDKKLKVKDLINKYNYINYIALFKIDDNPKIQQEIEKDDGMTINGTFHYPFDIKMAEAVYPINIKPITNSPEGYDLSTVVAINKKWVVQYEYKKSIYKYVENYSSRMVFSHNNPNFDYKTSIYFIIVGGTLLALWLGFNIYNKFNFRKFM